MNTYAGFWVRGVAKVIDEGLLMLVSWGAQSMVAGMYFWWQTFSGNVPTSEHLEKALSPFWVQAAFLLVYLVLSTLYYVYAHAWYGTTIGKRLFSIRVVNARTGALLTSTQSLWRCAAYTLSSLPFGAGFFMAALHPRKQALHDLVIHSISYYARKSDHGVVPSSLLEDKS